MASLSEKFYPANRKQNDSHSLRNQIIKELSDRKAAQIYQPQVSPTLSPAIGHNTPKKYSGYAENQQKYMHADAAPENNEEFESPPKHVFLKLPQNENIKSRPIPKKIEDELIKRKLEDFDDDDDDDELPNNAVKVRYQPYNHLSAENNYEASLEKKIYERIHGKESKDASERQQEMYGAYNINDNEEKVMTAVEELEEEDDYSRKNSDCIINKQGFEKQQFSGIVDQRANFEAGMQKNKNAPEKANFTYQQPQLIPPKKHIAQQHQYFNDSKDNSEELLKQFQGTGNQNGEAAKKNKQNYFSEKTQMNYIKQLRQDILSKNTTNTVAPIPAQKQNDPVSQNQSKKIENTQIPLKSQKKETKQNEMTIDQHLKELNEKEKEIYENIKNINNIKKIEKNQKITEKYDIPIAAVEPAKTIQFDQRQNQNASHVKKTIGALYPNIGKTENQGEILASKNNQMVQAKNLNQLYQENNTQKISDKLVYSASQPQAKRYIDNFESEYDNNNNKIQIKSPTKQTGTADSVSMAQLKIERLSHFIKEMKKYESGGNEEISGSGQSFYHLNSIDRNELWLEAKKTRQMVQKKLSEDQELDNCTFHPHIYSSPNYRKILNKNFATKSIMENESHLNSQHSGFTYVNLKAPHDRSRSLSKERKSLNSYAKAQEMKAAYKQDIENSMIQYLPSAYPSPKSYAKKGNSKMDDVQPSSFRSPVSRINSGKEKPSYSYKLNDTSLKKYQCSIKIKKK